MNVVFMCSIVCPPFCFYYGLDRRKLNMWYVQKTTMIATIRDFYQQFIILGIFVIVFQTQAQLIGMWVKQSEETGGTLKTSKLQIHKNTEKCTLVRGGMSSSEDVPLQVFCCIRNVGRCVNVGGFTSQIYSHPSSKLMMALESRAANYINRRDLQFSNCKTNDVYSCPQFQNPKKLIA